MADSEDAADEFGFGGEDGGGRGVTPLPPPKLKPTQKERIGPRLPSPPLLPASQTRNKFGVWGGG